MHTQQMKIKNGDGFEALFQSQVMKLKNYGYGKRVGSGKEKYLNDNYEKVCFKYL